MEIVINTSIALLAGFLGGYLYNRWLQNREWARQDKLAKQSKYDSRNEEILDLACEVAAYIYDGYWENDKSAGKIAQAKATKLRSSLTKFQSELDSAQKGGIQKFIHESHEYVKCLNWEPTSLDQPSEHSEYHERQNRLGANELSNQIEEIKNLLESTNK